MTSQLNGCLHLYVNDLFLIIFLIMTYILCVICVRENNDSSV